MKLNDKSLKIVCTLGLFGMAAMSGIIYAYPVAAVASGIIVAKKGDK